VNSILHLHTYILPRPRKRFSILILIFDILQSQVNRHLRNQIGLFRPTSPMQKRMFLILRFISQSNGQITRCDSPVITVFIYGEVIVGNGGVFPYADSGAVIGRGRNKSPIKGSNEVSGVLRKVGVGSTCYPRRRGRLFDIL
jgi:hypothetical protein